LTDFNFKVKKTSAKSFAEAQKSLQKLKDIKKNYKKPETTAWLTVKKEIESFDFAKKNFIYQNLSKFIITDISKLRIIIYISIR
jgi:hypothetical protein